MNRLTVQVLAVLTPALIVTFAAAPAAGEIGQETSSYRRLADGDEFVISQEELIARGKDAFAAE